MGLMNVNKKRMSVKYQRLLMFMAAIMMALVTFTACAEGEDNPDENGNGDEQIETYTGSESETDYKLTITGNADRIPYEPKAGDSYSLTASSKSSSGKVTSFDGTEFTLKPSNSSTSFNATVLGNELTGIFGTITWKDNSSTQGPGDFIPYVNNDPNVMESNHVKKGTIIYSYPGISAGGTYKYVFDDVLGRYSSTGSDNVENWMTIVYDCYNGRWYLWADESAGPYYHECTNLDCDCSTDCATRYHTAFQRVYDFTDSANIPELQWRRIGDQTIAGKICSVYANQRYELAVYRGIVFKRIQEGETKFVVESFTESISEKDFSPPDGYTLVYSEDACENL